MACPIWDSTSKSPYGIGLKDPSLKFYLQQGKGGFKNMIFLLADDVAKLGVTVSYTPNGVTRKDFNKVLAAFPAPGKIIK